MKFQMRETPVAAILARFSKSAGPILPKGSAMNVVTPYTIALFIPNPIKLIIKNLDISVVRAPSLAAKVQYLFKK